MDQRSNVVCPYGVLKSKQFIKNYVRFPYNIVQKSLDKEYIQFNKLTNVFNFKKYIDNFVQNIIKLDLDITQ